jgi:hypothetical protein
MLRFIVLVDALLLPPQPAHSGNAAKPATITRMCRCTVISPDVSLANLA